MKRGRTTIGDLTSGAGSPLNAYWSVRLLQVPRIVLLTRTSEPLQAVVDIERCIEDVARLIPRQRRAGWRIILDMRLGPTRVHPALDPAFARFRKETHAGFTRVAIIVATPLQPSRSD